MKKPIRGWLLVLLIYIWISVVDFSGNLLIFVSAYIGHDHATLLEKINAIKAAVILPLLIVSFVFLLQRKRAFIPWMIWIQIVIILVQFMYLIFHVSIIGALIGCAQLPIILGYLAYSKRVRDTLVN